MEEKISEVLRENNIKPHQVEICYSHDRGWYLKNKNLSEKVFNKLTKKIINGNKNKSGDRISQEVQFNVKPYIPK